MAGYDPKQKRAHSTPAAEGPAPVDDLLGGPPKATEPASPATAPPMAERAAPSLATTPRPSSPPATGPDPKVLALAAGVAVLAIVLWRRRR
jgi:hypothetical protein